METLVQEVADRVKSEVDKVKMQCNANIRRLTDEIEVGKVMLVVKAKLKMFGLKDT